MLVRDNFFVSYADKKRAEDLRGPFPCGRCCKGKSDQIHQIQNEGPLTMPHEQSACSFRKILVKAGDIQLPYSITTVRCRVLILLFSNRFNLYRPPVWKWNKCTEEPVSAVPELTWEVRQKVVLPVRNRFKRPEPYSLTSRSNILLAVVSFKF